MLFDKSAFLEYAYESEVTNSASKRERLLFICKTLKLNHLIEKCIDAVHETATKHGKCEETANLHLDSGKTRFKPDSTIEIFEAIIEDLTEAIWHAPFGGETFAEAYSLRAKCHLKIAKYTNALYDSDVALKYGGYNYERILIKSIALFAMNRIEELKDFLLTEEVYTVPIDPTVEAHVNRLGFSFISMKYLRDFLWSSDEMFGDIQEDSIKDDLNGFDEIVETLKKAWDTMPGDQFESFADAEVDKVTGGNDQLMKRLKNHFVQEFLLSNKEQTETKQKQNELMRKVINFEMNYVKDDRVEIVVDTYRGRYMKAKEFIPKDTTILAEKAFSFGLMPNQIRKEYCLFCHSWCIAKSIPCKYCIDAVFCNETCFENAWNLFHQHECRIISVFDEQYLYNQHLYRSLNRVGMWNAISVFDKFTQLKTDPVKLDEAKLLGVSVERVINDSIIRSYLDNKTLQIVPPHEQTEQQRMQVFEMQNTLLDHNEKYEEYYDISYMSIALNVTLLLMLNEYLRKQTDSPAKFTMINFEEMQKALRVIEFRLLDDELEDCEVFGQPFEVLIKLVHICQLAIRKLTTNVFSWSRYYSDGKTKIGNCQILVGSFVNHCCDPNIEWEFSNGCCAYTTIKDVQPDEEINNSYGACVGIPFLNRQIACTNNYYFNCYCSACKMDVCEYSNVLQCLQCAGPVVLVPQAFVPATCMLCFAEYRFSNERMLKVNEQRAKFKQLMRYFNQPSVRLDPNPLESQTFLKYYALLTKSIDYQLTYLYCYNRDLQYNLMLYCSVLARVGKMEEAFKYSRHVINPELSHLHSVSDELVTHPGSSTPEKCIENAELDTFYLKMFKDYLGPESTDGEEDAEKLSYNQKLAKIYYKHFQKKYKIDLEKLMKRFAEELILTQLVTL